jgi:hypothetical protein
MQWRRHLPLICHPSQGSQHFSGSVQEIHIELDGNAPIGANIVDDALLARKAILSQSQALGGKLNQMGLEDPLWIYMPLTALVFHRSDFIPIPLQ